MKPSHKRLTLLLLAAAMVSFFSASCRNTTHGAGQDIENAGQHIEKSTH